jgi:hypothetical protein
MVLTGVPICEQGGGLEASANDYCLVPQRTAVDAKA